MNSGYPTVRATSSRSNGWLYLAAVCWKRGVCDLSVLAHDWEAGGGERGTSFHLNNPLWSLGAAEGEHLDWLRSRLSLLLVAGQGQWEDTTGALDSTRRFADVLNGKGMRCELDLWAHDVPHDWPSWRSQLAHHMPRFC